VEYFLMCQDGRVGDAIRLVGLGKALGVDGFGQGLAELGEEPVQVYLEEGRRNDYVDFVARPFPLVSDQLKQLLALYEPAAFFKPVVLADKQRMYQAVYWLAAPAAVACLAPAGVFTQTSKESVLDGSKIGDRNFFRLAGSGEHLLVVNLHVAESIYRRDFFGICLKRLEVC
jgi:hypothetical protein